MCFDVLLARLEPETRFRIRSLMSGRLNGEVQFGSACSGTELPLLAWQAWGRVCTVDLETPVANSHAFGCERSAQKRKFLSQVVVCMLVLGLFPGCGLQFGTESAGHFRMGGGMAFWNFGATPEVA